jgi:uncharacterized membrane protein (DUF485 family)
MNNKLLHRLYHSSPFFIGYLAIITYTQKWLSTDILLALIGIIFAIIWIIGITWGWAED